MKHIKEFQLNEGESEIYGEQIRNFQEFEKLVIGDLIEDYEYTDSFLEQKEVKSKIDETIQKLVNNYDKTLKELNSYFESKYPLKSPGDLQNYPNLHGFVAEPGW